jgi:uncharacterized membrane protein
MLEALASGNNRRTTLVLVLAAAALVLAGLAVGVSDNPPGIALVSLASVTLVAAAVHPWRSPRPFVFLLVAGVLGFALAVVLSNLLEGAAGVLAAGSAFAMVVEALGGLAFLLAVFISPAAVLVGASGAIVMSVRHRWPGRRATHAS